MTITFKSQLQTLAGRDRVATVQTMLEVLSELGAIREASANVMYDHRMIGAHQIMREQVAQEIGTFLLHHGVIAFEQSGGGNLILGNGQPQRVELRGSLFVVLPGEQQPATVEIEQDRQEVEPEPPHHLAAWQTGLPLGFHRIHWKSGGTSLAAIGMKSDGTRWIAPCNWVSPADMPKPGTWADIERTELLFAYPEDDGE